LQQWKPNQVQAAPWDPARFRATAKEFLHMRITGFLSALLLMFTFGMGATTLTGCDQGDIEEGVEEVEEGAEEAGEAVQEGAGEAGEAMEEGAENMEEGAEDMAE
jgi:hypothetical protein